MRIPELLVPASSLEVLQVAVIFGADAVYIGGEAFGLRAKAKNFSKEDMSEGVRFAHEHGVKVYVTANILAHNQDLEGVRKYFEELREIGPDALIISDPGVYQIAKEVCPEIELIPEVFDGASLGEKMAKECEPGAKILLARAAIGNKEVIEELAKREDLIVDDVAIYDTFYENQDLIDEKGQFESGKIDCAVFTSASTVKGFVAATEGLDYTKVLAACIGKQTQEEALRYGMKTAVAKEASIDSLVELVIKLKGQREKNQAKIESDRRKEEEQSWI